MTAHTLKTIRSLRVCAHLNIRQARAARNAGRERLALYHAHVALACRRDALSLR